ncbi:MAG: hypothetical protein VYE15_00290, partial [Myxococcota bacterium]|nr:hypothetical protein [Myxococcota bacterium]
MTAPSPISFVASTLCALALLAPVSLADVPSPLWTEGPSATGLSPDAPVNMRAFADLAETASPAVVNIAVLRKGK